MRDGIISSTCALVFGYSGNYFINKINRNLFNIFNKNIRKHRNIQFKRVKQFIEDHNEFCKLLAEINQFWSKIYLVFLLTIFPINLIWMHQFFFEQLDYLALIFIGPANLIMFLEIVLIQYRIAKVSNNIHKTDKILVRIQWTIKGWPFRLKPKLKLQTYFERLSSKKKIGISIGPIIVLTVPVFAQVCFYEPH